MAEIHAQVQTRVANKEVPYVKIMPSRPHEAYQQLQEDDRDYLIGIKESEACPCPELRQLLLMYASRKCTNLDIPICDILQEKFSQDKTADSDHCTIVSNLENFVGELSRLVQLKKCVDYYKELSHLLSDFPNSDQGELNSEKQLIENERNATLRSLKSQPQGYNELEAKKIEEKYDAMLIDKYLATGSKIEEFMEAVKDIDQHYGWFLIFSSEFQKVIDSLTNKLRVEKANSSGNPSQQFELFVTALGRSESDLDFQTTALEKKLFRWRNALKISIKEKPRTTELEQTMKRCQNLQLRTSNEVYARLEKVKEFIRSHRQDTSQKRGRFQEQYGRYLSLYYDYKEIQVLSKKADVISSVFLSEKVRFNDHLKANYGMVMPYTKSDAYCDFCMDFVESKSQMQKFIKAKIEKLDRAIKFVNDQYSVLYKRACEGQSGVKNAVAEKIKIFEAQVREQEDYAVHLLQACRRLLLVAKN